MPTSIHIPSTSLQRIVVIGGGFGGIEFCKAIDSEKFQVVLIDKYNYHTFQPLLYQVATAGLEPSSIAGPLRKLFEGKKNFYFRMGEVNKIHPEKNCITTSLGDLTYNYLVIATGTKASYFGKEENYKHSFPLKYLPHALDLRNTILRGMEEALLVDDPKEKQKLLNIVIVGGGPTGVEVAGALSELRKHVLPKDYPELDFKLMQIYLIEGTDRLLGAMTQKSSQDAFDALQKMNIHIKLNKLVLQHDGEEATLSDGTIIPCKILVWAAGVTGSLIEGLPSEAITKSNRFVVNEFLQVKGSKNIFALGDIAFMQTPGNADGHPQLAPVAIQQGILLAENLNRKGKPVSFHYTNKGVMATIGRNKAVADLSGNIHFKGFIAWMMWLVVHILLIIGFRNRLVILLNWIWNYLTYDRSIRLILKARK
ncbi:MAG: NAD(P)/FAD-dependent oxidoreductase [Chitinophagales bacterium]|nr:NAD(P)/FAD-dependent oxidoreductase [Chitinophagales bacterium]